MRQLAQPFLRIILVLAACQQVAHARNYDPSTGRWMQRDPAGYVDGNNQYQYARSNPTKYTDWQGRSAADLNHQKQAAESCKNWADKESKRDQSWRETLPDCPCEIDVSDPSSPKYTCGTDKDKWKSIETRDQGPRTWEPYHPKAQYQLRSKSQGDGSGQQCTYDQNGKLITGGESAGTPDRVTPDFYYAPVLLKDVGLVLLLITSGGEAAIFPEDFLPGTVVGHRREDVGPFAACRDAGMLDTYFKHRPPNQGNDGNGNSCPGNSVD